MKAALRSAADRLCRTRLGKGWAMGETLRGEYTVRDLLADFYASLSVTVVALPLSLAFAIAAGIPPQFGLYSAIIAGTLVPLIGGSRNMVTGPPASFITLLFPIMVSYGLGGVMLATFMSGFFLIIMGMAHFGKLIQFLPYPVTTGFSTGIGVVIIVLQLKDFLGLEIAGMPTSFLDRMTILVEHLPTVRWEECLIGLLTIGLLVGLPKVGRWIPAPIISITVAGIAAWLLNRYVPGFSVQTISSRYSFTHGGETFAGIGAIPPIPTLPWHRGGADGAPLELSADLIRELVGPSFTIAVLAAMVTMLTATVADGMGGTKHHSDRELVSQGVGNMVCGIFGGVPASGVLARTTANIRAGTRSPLSAAMHGVLIFAVVMLAAPMLSTVPLAALAGVLIVVALNMIDVGLFRQMIKVAPRSDMIVFLTCFGLTVLIDMVTAVVVGVILAALLFMKRMSENTNTRLLDSEVVAPHGNAPEGVLVYEIAGPLFFGATERAISTIQNYATAQQPKVVVLILDHVGTMDVTALVAFQSALKKLRDMQIMIVISGAAGQPKELLLRAGIVSKPGELAYCFDLEQALMLASLHVDSLKKPSKHS